MTGKEYRKMTLAVMKTKRWRTTAVIRNSLAELPSGTEVKVEDKMNGLNIQAPPCAHCGVSVRVRRVSPLDIEEIR